MHRAAAPFLLLAVLVAAPTMAGAISPPTPSSASSRLHAAEGVVHYSYLKSGTGCDAAYSMLLWQEKDGTWSYDIVTSAWPLCNTFLLYRRGGVGDLETGITWTTVGCGVSVVTLRLESTATARYVEDWVDGVCMDTHVVVEGALAITPGVPP